MNKWIVIPVSIINLYDYILYPVDQLEPNSHDRGGLADPLIIYYVSQPQRLCQQFICKTMPRLYWKYQKSDCLISRIQTIAMNNVIDASYIV